MKKLLSITCLIICLILMLSSCSKDYKLKKTFDEYESGSTIHSASKISELDGATYRSTYAMQVNSKRYVYESFTDDIMIVDGSGKVIGTINSITSYNGENLVIENVIYDWNLNKKYDLDENNATISKAMAHCFIITKDGKYYRYSDTTTMQELGTTSDISLYANFYVVKNQNEYNVYNDLGEKIVALQSDSSIYLSCSFEGNYIARTYSNTSGYQYYILAK